MAPRLDDENPAPTVETDETPNVMPPHTVLAISPHPTSIRPRTCPPFPHTQPALAPAPRNEAAACVERPAPLALRDLAGKRETSCCS